MTESPSQEELISRFKSQPADFSESELYHLIESLQEPSRNRGLYVGIALSSLVSLAVAAFFLLMPTSPGLRMTSHDSQVLADEDGAASLPISGTSTRPLVPDATLDEEAIEPVKPHLGQCVFLTATEIADLGIEVTDSSIILNSLSGRSEYLRDRSLHHFGQSTFRPTSHIQTEPVAIVSNDGNLLQYRIPHAAPMQFPVPSDSNTRQFAEIRIDWDNPQRERLLAEYRESTDRTDTTVAVRYIFMTKEQTDSFRVASRKQLVQTRINIVDGVKAGRLIPLKIRLDRTGSSVRTPDVTLWYKPTDDFLQKLPPGFASAIRSELRGNGGSCTYTTSCLEVGSTLQLINVHFDPTSELVRLELRSTTAQHVVIKLFNTIGVPVGSVSLDAVEGMNSLHIPIAQGNHGLIFLTAKSTSGEQVASRVFIGPR